MKQSKASYTRNVTEAISSQDGTKLASLLSHRDRHATNVFDDINRTLPSALSRLIGRELDEPWDDVVLSHFNVVLSLQGGGGSGKLKAKDLGKQNLVLTFTKVLRSGDIPQLERFPASHRIEFWYYSGMLAFLDEQYDTAEQRRGDSFNHCLRTVKHNKYLILTYLIPLRMLRGKLPTSALFKKITVALRKGDVKTFDRLVEEKEEILVPRQVFLVVVKLRGLCLRNLLKRIHKISATVSGTRLALAPIQTALSWLGCNSGDREVECVVANLIDKGYIRGYISHERQILVLPKENAFPPVSSVSVS
ncbi:hypothetical protein M427DRAFT_56514 [Gonapodya prolifera JEL478]|uniref:PCI domain-containing protein n=1 Tax=Gonapodya prolifera (strain JEL478) TaxID=1344416 RepID=A0A139AFU8_GONPJ|nr:hypothetical protein M427DRAFT_56514 [Gonapodya prolifera JEL478]|eukprot:KXS15676.1 hypothetical protein M427DRAFT_56514 [Gonapodya prolifera JEL478]